MTPTTLKALSSAVQKLLRPLVRILLRNGISYGTFTELAKWVYVDVATKDFRILRRKQSTSRVAVLTGLTRKEVQRLSRVSGLADRESEERYNRAARVIAGWRRERDFLDAQGRPAPLPMIGETGSFSALVKRFSGDMPPRAVLDELERVGAARQLDDGRVDLVARAYIAETTETDKLHILGTDVSYLIATIDHNVRPDRMEPLFQRKVAYDNLPDQALPEFRKLSAEKAQTLLEHLDQWLARRDRDTQPDVVGEGRNRAGVGIYYFEEPYEEGDE
ncbi:MAG TPA: DUF6502 family protein [Syntrophobacteria bacterium]|nr:DUF6502 family protein [Syntrophobacteria bacterium]